MSKQTNELDDVLFELKEAPAPDHEYIDPYQNAKDDRLYMFACVTFCFVLWGIAIVWIVLH